MGSWKTEMADSSGVEFRDRWYVDDISVMDDGVVALLERHSFFLIFLIAFACIFVRVDVDMASTARWK